MKLLDLFCGAGGASMGYHLAGWDVTGIDAIPQPNYPFRFIQGDALTVDLSGYDAIHASPPCQAYTSAGNIWLSRLGPAIDRHPDLIELVRNRLIEANCPYIIENVFSARKYLINPILLCGQTLGLGVKRHRMFECTFPVSTSVCPKSHPGNWISVFGNGALSRTPKGGQKRINGKHNGRGAYDGRTHILHADACIAMGIDWMNRNELSQAIPPAYTELIGNALIKSTHK